MFSFMYCRSVVHRALSHDGFNPGSSFTSDLHTTFASLCILPSPPAPSSRTQTVSLKPSLCVHGELRQRREMQLGATQSDTSSWLTSALWAEKSLKQQGFLPWDSGGSTSAAQPLPSPASGPRHSPAPRICACATAETCMRNQSPAAPRGRRCRDRISPCPAPTFRPQPIVELQQLKLTCPNCVQVGLKGKCYFLIRVTTRPVLNHLLLTLSSYNFFPLI